MAYTLPTADDFTEKFPELEDTDEDIIDAAIAEAARMVDTTWTEGDYATAILYMAAHLVSGALAMADTVGGAAISAVSIGQISISYLAGLATSSEASATPYGVRYLALRKRNVGGPIIV